MRLLFTSKTEFPRISSDLIVPATLSVTVNPVGIITSSDAVGTKLVSQLSVLFQLVLAPNPVQVVCAIAIVLPNNNNSSKNRFIINSF